MESDIIAEGFCLSEVQHGLCYMRVTVDGDSSVMCTIIQSVLYGPFIQKVECANHVCKCYHSRLEALCTCSPRILWEGWTNQAGHSVTSSWNKDSNKDAQQNKERATAPPISL